MVIRAGSRQAQTLFHRHPDRNPYNYTDSEVETITLVLAPAAVCQVREVHRGDR
jgi:hypothetical protein